MSTPLADLITSPDAANYFQVRRWRATAATWFQKVAVSLRWQYDNTDSGGIKSLISDDAARLMVETLQHTWRLVPLLRDDSGIYSFEMVEAEAHALVKRLANERLAQKMDNTAGRTPIEAEAFAAKAAELRAS